MLLLKRTAQQAAAATTVPLRLLLGAAVTLSLWVVFGGLWETTVAVRTAFDDTTCGGSPRTMPFRQLPRQKTGEYDRGFPWVQDAQAEYLSRVEHLELLRKHSETLRGFVNASQVVLPGSIGGVQPPSNRSRSQGNDTQPFLFVGVLSVPESLERRQAARETWMITASRAVTVRFVMYKVEATPAMLAENEQYGDIIFVDGGAHSDYRSIVYKTFALVEWVAANLQPKFILKTDDDAYVHTGNLVSTLKKLCRNPDCNNEKLYMGVEKRNGAVITEAGHKWSNTEYYQLTGIREYAPYMYGGGYIFSADVAKALHEVHAIAPLKFMPNEDATFGFWVMGMDLQHIDHPKMRTAAGQCCFYTMPDVDATGRARHAAIRTYETLCDNWLVLHKVEGNDQMRYLHHRMQSCPLERAVLKQAYGLASARPSPLPPALPLRPLQVYAMSDWRRGYHFSAANDVRAWSADGSRLLSLRSSQLPHDVEPGDSVEIGYIPFNTGKPLTMEHSGWDWVPVTSTRAWGYQLGARAQWVGASNDLIVFNERSCAANVSSDELCAQLYNITSRQRIRELPRPVFALSPDGTLAAAICMKRLEHASRGWGYTVSKAARKAARAQKHPLNDGLWVTNVATGKAHLAVSLRQLHEVTTKGRFSWAADPVTNLDYREQRKRGSGVDSRCIGWINKPAFNREGTHLVFIYHVSRCKPSSIAPVSFLFTVGVDGKDLWRIPVVQGRSHDFGPDGKLLVCDANGAYLVDNRKGVTPLQKPKAIAAEGDGPCKLFSGGHRWVLGDTFRQPHKLYVWDLYRSDVFTVNIFGTADWPGPEYARTSLNPQWSPDGRYVSFDSTHTWETGMQTYVVGIQSLGVGVPPSIAPPTAQRSLYCDLAVRSGAAMRHFLDGEPAPGRFDVHIWEAGITVPQQKGALAGNLQAVRAIAKSVTLYSSGAGVNNLTVAVNPLGNSRYDVSMKEMRTIVFGGQPAGRTHHASWWKSHFGCKAWNTCTAVPLRGDTMPDDITTHDVELQMEDFSAWLAGAARESDYVVVAMDLGSGREFELLQHLVQDGTIALIDKLYIRWHYQLSNWHWLGTYEYIFSMLGIAVEYLSEVQPT